MCRDEAESALSFVSGWRTFVGVKELVIASIDVNTKTVIDGKELCQRSTLMGDMLE
jgi:hypothetical protein